MNTFESNGLHMLCLSAVGEISAGLATRIRKLYNNTVSEWISTLLDDNNVQQFSVHAHANCITIVKKEDLVIVQPKFISHFISEQAECSFQHFRVQLTGAKTVMPVINCHAPSAGKSNLTT